MYDKYQNLRITGSSYVRHRQLDRQKRFQTFSFFIVYEGAISTLELKTFLKNIFKIENDSNWEYLIRVQYLEDNEAETLVYIKFKEVQSISLTRLQIRSTKDAYSGEGPLVWTQVDKELALFTILQHSTTFKESEDFLTNINLKPYTLTLPFPKVSRKSKKAASSKFLIIYENEVPVKELADFLRTAFKIWDDSEWEFIMRTQYLPGGSVQNFVHISFEKKKTVYLKKLLFPGDNQELAVYSGLRQEFSFFISLQIASNFAWNYGLTNFEPHVYKTYASAISFDDTSKNLPKVSFSIKVKKFFTRKQEIALDNHIAEYDKEIRKEAQANFIILKRRINNMKNYQRRYELPGGYNERIALRLEICKRVVLNGESLRAVINDLV